MVHFPSGWCIFRRDGASSVGMVLVASGLWVLHVTLLAYVVFLWTKASQGSVQVPTNSSNVVRTLPNKAKRNRNRYPSTIPKGILRNLPKWAPVQSPSHVKPIWESWLNSQVVANQLLPVLPNHLQKEGWSHIIACINKDLLLMCLLGVPKRATLISQIND